MKTTLKKGQKQLKTIEQVEKLEVTPHDMGIQYYTPFNNWSYYIEFRHNTYMLVLKGPHTSLIAESREFLLIKYNLKNNLRSDIRDSKLVGK